METPGNWGSWTHEDPRSAATQNEVTERNPYRMYPTSWAPELDEVETPKPTPEQVVKNPVVKMAVEASLQV